MTEASRPRRRRAAAPPQATLHPQAVTAQPAADLTLLRALAGLLQRLEASRLRVSAEQYRAVARQLAQALSDVHADAALHALLDANPAAAEIYENQNYRHAGLCRCALELALWSEFLAREVLHKAALCAREKPLR